MIHTLALDENMDFWDIAIVAAAMREEEKAVFNRSFNLDNFTAQQCRECFRFLPHDIVRLSRCLGMPDSMSASNGTTAPGRKLG